jgi:dipeptidyl aminopeptidase/acylaminoacyl peptidase
MTKLEERYELNGWPALQRPDLSSPDGWDLSLLAAIQRIRNHQLSPDGQKIVFVWDRDDLSDIYVMPAQGGWPRRMTTQRNAVAHGSDETPQWSPDSERIAFCMNGNVYVIPSDGGIPFLVSDFAASVSEPVWMPDSYGLIVTVVRSGRQQLVLTTVAGEWPRPLVTTAGGDAWGAQPSPDGVWVAYSWRRFDDLQRHELQLVNVESGAILPLLNAPNTRNHSPRWAPDGQTIAFISDRSGFDEVWLIRLDGEGLRRLTQVNADISDIAWSPDGAYLAGVVNREGAHDLVLIDGQSGDLTDLRTGQGIYSHPHWGAKGEFLTVEYENPLQPPDLFRIRSDGRAEQLTFSNLPALERNALITPELVSYESYDGLQVPAFLYRPDKANGAAVVNPHGGPAAQSLCGWNMEAQYFVAKGYTWLAPNYRGSTGYGRDYERLNYNSWGQGDVQDCLYAARFLKDCDWVEPASIGIYGGSYGGYLTACALARDPDYLYACGISKYGDANLLTSWAQCNRHLRIYTETFLDNPSRNRQAYVDGSPIFQVENIQKPVLILHGLLDDVVPPQASEEWAAALRRAGKSFEYKSYANEPHGFLKRATLLDAYARIERFLDWHLLPLV